MTDARIENDSLLLLGKSLVTTFRSPARRFLLPNPFCDNYGSVVDFHLNGVRYFCEESPLMVQPDLLVDRSTKDIVGLTFELTSPDWMLPRCQEMLRGLDSNAIRITGGESVPTDAMTEYLFLDVNWGNASNSERVFAQLDFGLWAFLYSSATPSLFRDSKVWTPPAGLIIGELRKLNNPVSIIHGETGEAIVAEK